MIKIGIEASRRNLHCDLLDNPGRYFFILDACGRMALCIQTCDSQGEDITTQMIDCLSLDDDGNLTSIFEDCVNKTIQKPQECRRHSSSGEPNGYPVSSQLAEMLSMMPGLMDWIISSILTNGRNLVIYPSEDAW